MDHALYLVLAIVTHGAVGYALVRVLTPYSPVLGVLGGTLPDVDLYFGRVWDFPLVHRGLVHTPLFLGVLLGVLLLLDVPEGVPLAFGLAFCSHLVVDSFTNAGVMWLYPLTARHFAYDVSAHSFVGDVLLWTASYGAVHRLDRNGLALPSPGHQ